MTHIQFHFTVKGNLNLEILAQNVLKQNKKHLNKSPKSNEIKRQGSSRLNWFIQVSKHIAGQIKQGFAEIGKEQMELTCRPAL